LPPGAPSTTVTAPFPSGIPAFLQVTGEVSMAAGTRWMAGAFRALLAACGGGEAPGPAPSGPPAEAAPSPSSMPSESGSAEAAPAAAQPSAPLSVDEAQAFSRVLERFETLTPTV